MNTRGYFSIGIYRPKTVENVGTLWRTAFSFGASSIFTIGQRYKRQPSDTLETWKHIPLINFSTWDEFKSAQPFESLIVGIENSLDARPIKDYIHPERATYVLGSEDDGLPTEIRRQCNHIVILPGTRCHNVSITGAMVMFDRIQKGAK